MAAIETVRNPSIYLLRDHLDAALAMGEDLLTETLALDTPAGRSALRTWMRQNRDLNDFLTTVRTLEYAMTARLLQARKRAEEVKRSESRLKPLDRAVRGRHRTAGGCRRRAGRYRRARFQLG